MTRLVTSHNTKRALHVQYRMLDTSCEKSTMHQPPLGLLGLHTLLAEPTNSAWKLLCAVSHWVPQSTLQYTEHTTFLMCTGTKTTLAMPAEVITALHAEAAKYPLLFCSPCHHATQLVSNVDLPPQKGLTTLKSASSAQQTWDPEHR